MCSPFSASVWVIRRDASLTCSATSSLICEMSWLRSRCTLLMASRICSAWPTSVSRWPPRSCSRRADAHFVVVVGVLERGDLVGDQRLELGGARQRALDAVAHGGDFAADRLADGDDGFARHRLRLGEPHGDLGHGLGDEPQFLRAPCHVREHVEEDDRREERSRPSTPAPAQSGRSAPARPAVAADTSSRASARPAPRRRRTRSR